MGSTKAFLNDGVLQFKRKWGLRIINDTWNGYFINILSNKKSIQSWLINNPFIFKEGNHLGGAVFLPSNSTTDKLVLEKILNNFFLPGLKRFHVYKVSEASTTRTGLKSKSFETISIIGFNHKYQVARCKNNNDSLRGINQLKINDSLF